MPSNAQTQFINQIGYVDQLIAIHRKLQTGKGRRHEQDALHRAGVVMIVAAWESYIEKLVMEALNAIEQNACSAASSAATTVPPWARHTYSLRRAEIAKSVERINTPNDTEVRNLLHGTLEFNPWLHWSWHSRRRQWGEIEVRNYLNQWILIRHSVAHGFPLPNTIKWLKDRQHRPRLTLNLLNQCKRFFEHVVNQTDNSFRLWLKNHHRVENPW
jgi:hypothetical protein